MLAGSLAGAFGTAAQLIAAVSAQGNAARDTTGAELVAVVVGTFAGKITASASLASPLAGTVAAAAAAASGAEGPGLGSATCSLGSLTLATTAKQALVAATLARANGRLAPRAAALVLAGVAVGTADEATCGAVGALLGLGSLASCGTESLAPAAITTTAATLAATATANCLAAAPAAGLVAGHVAVEAASALGSAVVLKSTTSGTAGRACALADGVTGRGGEH